MKKALNFTFLCIAFLTCSIMLKSQEINSDKSYLEVNLFDLPAVIDLTKSNEFFEDGNFSRGKLFQSFELKNTKAKVIIPKGIEVEYDKEIDSYVFLLNDFLVEVISESVSYKVHGFLLFDKNHGFYGRVGEDTYFEHNGQNIIFLINDAPSWSDNVEFDYNYYSKKYRDKIEYDILIDHEIINIDTLENQFAAHEGLGMQQYYGESFLVKINTRDINLRIEEIKDGNEIIRCFNSMKVGRPYYTSYKNKIILPLKIFQPDKKLKDGLLELIATNDEFENLSKILNQKDNVYLLFRMGDFNDFKVSGFGILYFCYSQKQYDTILSGF